MPTTLEQEVKEVTCLHTSDVETTPEGDISTCRVCGQEILTIPGGKEQVLKRGSIEGKITRIHPEVLAAAELAEGEVTHKPTSSKREAYFKKLREKKDAYFEQNRKAILADYKSSMTLRKFLLKWHMSPKTWTRLKELWHVKPKVRGLRRRKESLVQRLVLPPLPPFNENWRPQVQIEWLRTYRDLQLGNSANGRK